MTLRERRPGFKMADTREHGVSKDEVGAGRDAVQQTVYTLHINIKIVLRSGDTANERKMRFIRLYHTHLI